VKICGALYLLWLSWRAISHGCVLNQSNSSTVY
jgi:threonine/homoserine/homoserine lactone efflux protein